MRDGIVVLIVSCSILWFFLFSGRVFHSDASNASNRDALVKLHGAIEVGSSTDEVRELFQRYATAQLRLHDERPDGWVIRMPMEFGASDWKLLLDFRDGKAVGVRLRTADGPPPADGPQDKQRDGSEGESRIVVPENLNADERRVIQIARQFLETNQNWTDAEFEWPKRREEGGWTILIWKLPKTPELDMFLTIDEKGRVTRGSIGLARFDVGEGGAE